jgi:hypothetical protein
MLAVRAAPRGEWAASGYDRLFAEKAAARAVSFESGRRIFLLQPVGRSLRSKYGFLA